MHILETGKIKYLVSLQFHARYHRKIIYSKNVQKTSASLLMTLYD